MVVQSEMAPSLVKQIFARLTGLKTRAAGTARASTIIVGIDGVTRLLARELEAAGRLVSLIDLEDATLAEGKAQDQLMLSSADADAASCVMAATANEDWNLRLCRTARMSFRVPMVITRLQLLGEVTSWARLNDAGMVRMSLSEMVSAVLGTVMPSSGLERVAQAPTQTQVAEVELLTPVFIGQRTTDLGLNGCEVVALRRNNLWVDDIELAELRCGDVLTLVGAKRALHKVRESFTSL